MIVYFGLGLDDLAYPKIIHTRAVSTVGYYYCGAQSFLSLLEIHLGLVGHPHNNQYLRIEQYRQALQKYLQQTPDAFFQASFHADQLATASALLERRDELVLAGWDFEISDTLPNRLKTLAVIEENIIAFSKLKQAETVQTEENKQPRTYLDAGFADRFVLVVQTLIHRSVPIQKIYLNEPIQLLPSYFQQLFEVLTSKNIIITLLNCQFPQEDTDLAILQKALWNKKNGKRKRLQLKQDGSLLVIRAKRETEAAAYLAQFFRNNPDFCPVFLIPEKNRILDNAFIHEGLPSLGIPSASLARPVLQILKLVTAFVWRPLDPYKIMEFVSLSVKPLRDDLATLIAKEMAQTPGLKSERWNRMIRDYFLELEKRASKDISIDVKKTRLQYDFWFERKRYDSSRVVPKEEVIEIFEYLMNWATKEYELTGSKQNSLLVLSEQAKRIHELLVTLPESETHLTNLQLERIVRTIYEPSPITFKEQEVGHYPYIHQPSSVIGQIQALVWWNFIDNETEHFFARWYKYELNYLQKLNLQLQTPQDENALLLWQRPRPILHTKDRLILVIPSQVEGADVQPHPLFSDLEATFEAVESITFNIDSKTGKACLSGFLIPKEIALATRQLGSPKPYLTVTENRDLEKRNEETFTSLESLFYYPYQWVFKHKLELRKTSILSVVKDTALMGNLAHRLFELLFQEAKVLQWNKKQVEKWVNARILKLLEREGAVLLMYGREPEKVAFINTLQFAAWSLISIIQNNGWKVYGTEQALEGEFMGIPVKGKTDLVLINQKKEFAVVDLKWKGATMRERIIRNEEDLQLVMYARLLTKDDKWAHTAYFIIKSGKMIARNNLAFQDAIAVMPDSDHVEINERIWRRMEKTYEWREEQLKTGNIEIRTETTLQELTEPGEGLSLSELTNYLVMKSKNAPYDDFKTLINLIE